MGIITVLARRCKRHDYPRTLDATGQVLDFHSLRHGFLTYLVTANVAPKVAQILARHSTITLTMDRYTHLGLVGQLLTEIAIASISGIRAFYTECRMQ